MELEGPEISEAPKRGIRNGKLRTLQRYKHLGERASVTRNPISPNAIAFAMANALGPPHPGVKIKRSD